MRARAVTVFTRRADKLKAPQSTCTGPERFWRPTFDEPVLQLTVSNNCGSPALHAGCWACGAAHPAISVRLLGGWRGAAVLLATFGLTLIKDLTFGIIAGCLIAGDLAAFGPSVEEEGS